MNALARRAGTSALCRGTGPRIKLLGGVPAVADIAVHSRPPCDRVQGRQPGFRYQYGVWRDELALRPISSIPGLLSDGGVQTGIDNHSAAIPGVVKMNVYGRFTAAVGSLALNVVLTLILTQSAGAAVPLATESVQHPQSLYRDRAQPTQLYGQRGHRSPSLKGTVRRRTAKPRDLGRVPRTDRLADGIWEGRRRAKSAVSGDSLRPCTSVGRLPAGLLRPWQS